MQRSKSSSAKRSRGKAATGSRHLALRSLLILVVVAACVYVLPSPWAFHIGGRFSPIGEWDGYGLLRAANGGHFLLFTHLRGGMVNNHGTGNCSFAGCDSLSGSAQLCTTGGQHYTFALTGVVHGWYTTNGAATDIDLAGGTPAALPNGEVVGFHGVWKGPVLPVANTGNTFTEVFTPAGAIRKVISVANVGSAAGELRYGTVDSFDKACHALAAAPR